MSEKAAQYIIEMTYGSPISVHCLGPGSPLGGRMKFLLAAGSYERILYGVDVTLEEGGGKVKEIKNSFAIPAHTGYIKAVASCSRFLVSGGTDETVRYVGVRP